MQIAPMAATLADDAAVANVAAYIASLPDFLPPATVQGDADRGKELYVTCESCHGAAGQGIWSMSAPRLSKVNDWYLVRQLQNYKQGIRGAHPSDLHGKQMSLVSGVLRDDQSINDTVAYINKL
jgi:cytochrome c oxidase subunit II